jgi:Glycosyl transferase family 11
MILARISGGLGNQMFQYAAARALADRLGTKLYIDLNWFDQSIQSRVAIQRPYWLSIFQLSKTTPTYQSRLALRLKFKTGIGARPELYRESQFHYDAGFRQLGDNLILEGNFTTEKYFRDIATKIREDFQFLPQLNAPNQTTLRQIELTNAVSLHVRRGDYVSDKETGAFFGLTPVQYYKAAYKYILEKVPGAQMFVFSDDIEWCRTNLGLGRETVFVSGNDGPLSYEDMRLMSSCQHHIIANSTFSWWGAWLGANPDKLVVAPKAWFSDPTHNTRDVIPPSWHSI